MSRKKMVIVALFTFILAPLLFFAFYFYNNRLFLIEAEILWGSKQFDEGEFRRASPALRAAMVADLMKSKKLIGEKCESVPEILGERTGDYYHSDRNFTYKLTEKQSANWILTSICGDSDQVENLIIRKSCCSISQKMLHWGIGAILP